MINEDFSVPENFPNPKEYNPPQEEKKKMKPNKKLLTLIGIGLVSLIVLGFLGFRYVAPFGTKIIYQFTSDKNRDKASGLTGATKSGAIETTGVNSLIIPQQLIRNNIVTFNLKLLSQKIDGVWVTLKFKGDPKEIKLGVRGSEKEKYQYLPLYNQILNTLTWSQLSTGQTTFWQREKIYQDISGLASKPPVGDDIKIATYFYNLSDIVMKENSSLSLSGLKIEKTLRGTHTLLVKVEKSPLILTVIKQDANVYRGEDVLSLQIFNGQNKIAEQLIPDDGVTDTGGLMMAPQKGEVKINEVKPGVYTIVLKDMSEGADVRIKSIEVNQPSLVFPTSFIVDEKPATLWTNAKKITLRTPHTVGIQTVKLDGKYDLKVEKEGKDFTFDLNSFAPKTATSSAGTAKPLHQLEIPKNDLGINGDGYFAFTQDSFFNPEPIKAVDLTTVSDINKIDYIIVNYQQVKKDGDWKIAQVYFDPKDIKIDGDKLYFSLEIPELQSYGGEITIDSLEVTVDKPGWFSGVVETKTDNKEANEQKIENKGFFKNIWNSIKGFFTNLWPFGKSQPPITKETPKPTSTLTPTVTVAPSPQPTATQSGGQATPTAKPTPTPIAGINKDIKISVLNSGAPAGYAKKYVDLIKTAGYSSVTAGNASTNLKDALITYPDKFKADVSIIENILKAEYKDIVKTLNATSSGIIVNIGAR
jgi:hypothetical protein